MENIIFSTAPELANAIRGKQVSALEVLEAHIAQIASHHSKLNAIVTIDESAATATYTSQPARILLR